MSSSSKYFRPVNRLPPGMVNEFNRNLNDLDRRYFDRIGPRKYKTMKINWRCKCKYIVNFVSQNKEIEKKILFHSVTFAASLLNCYVFSDDIIDGNF